MARGILAAAFIWVIGVEMVAWWCIDVSALGGEAFLPDVVWGVTPVSILAGVLIGRAGGRGRLDRRPEN
ncbi:hypothetical protein [Paraburkholderia piptadeniae]|nr:hypothetical protein [Paraburkholderia piptadeniae]